ncbi:hypothetical protein BSPCLSOX_890, partial [uncultured Gammaproteobacteria bacterium]
SVAYREKMILLYVLYQGIFWFIFVSTIGIFIKDWAWYKENAIYLTRERVRKKYLMVCYIFFLGLLLFVTIFLNIFEGSNFYMLYDQLDKVGRNNDILRWNSVYGFIFNRWALGSLSYSATFYFIVSILTTKILFTNNLNKGE